MTAPDQCCINVKKLLSIRRRPHMTQSGSPPHATTPFFDRVDALLRRQGRRGPPLDHEVTAAVALVKAGLTAHTV